MPRGVDSQFGLHCLHIYAWVSGVNKSTESGTIYARSSVIFPHRMAFVRGGVDAVKRGPKLNLIKKWGKCVWGGGGGRGVTLQL